MFLSVFLYLQIFSVTKEQIETSVYSYIKNDRSGGLKCSIESSQINILGTY